MSSAHAPTHPRIAQLDRADRAAPFSAPAPHHAVAQHWRVALSDGRRVQVTVLLPEDIVEELHDLGLDVCELHCIAGEHAVRDAAHWGGLAEARVTIELGWNDVCAHVPPR